MERLIIRGAAVTIAISPFLVEYARRHGARRVVLIPNPIGLEPFRAVGARRTAPPGGVRTLLFAGRFHDRQKNFDRLLRGFAAVEPSLRDRARLVVLGNDGGTLAAFRARAEELRIGRLVEFGGMLPRAEMAGRYAAADCFVFPSLYEALPNALIEAMAAGLPILTSTHPSCASLADETCGVLVDPLNTAEIAAGIARLLRLGPDEYRAMSAAAGRKTAAFDDAAVHRATAELYRALGGRR